MKKLIALLASCAMITCCFASCGSSDDDSSSAKKSTTSSSAEANDETTEADKSADDETEAAKTTEAEPEADTTEKAESGSKVDKALVGEWNGKDDEGLEASLIFGADGYGTMAINSSSMVYADGMDLYFEDVKCSPDVYTFDGKTLKIEIGGEVGLEMTRISGSDKDTLDGDYYLKGSAFEGAFGDTSGMSDKFSLELTLDGKKSVMYLRNCFEYTTEDGKIKFASGSSMFGSDSADYTVDGDTLTTVMGGVTETFKKAK